MRVTHKQVVNAINESIAAEREMIAKVSALPDQFLSMLSRDRKRSAFARDLAKREMKYRATNDVNVLLGIDLRREGGK